jgi:hypothetical protein
MLYHRRERREGKSIGAPGAKVPRFSYSDDEVRASGGLYSFLTTQKEVAAETFGDRFVVGYVRLEQLQRFLLSLLSLIPQSAQETAE